MKILLEISLANACVNACPYCVMKGYISHVLFDRYLNAEGGGVYLDPHGVLDFIGQMREAHPEGIVIALTGGEPMCHPAFECMLDSIKFANRECDRIVLFSNLKLLSARRIRAINDAVDFLVAGYHPTQKPCPSNQGMGDARTRKEYGEFQETGREWLKGQLDKLTCAKAINYVAGAYPNEDLKGFEIWATENRLPYVKTPCAGRHAAIGEGGAHLQLNPAPDMLSVRADGTIIRCSGQQDAIGSIYENKYSKEMLCKRNCSMCPSFWCYFGSEHLFNEEEA